MAAPKAPVLDVTGKKSKDLTLEASVFAVELKPHLVHETVRAELNARRAGTHAAKSRGRSPAAARSRGGRRERAAPARARFAPRKFTGGGVAFPPTPRSYDVKVNKKVRRAALRAALSAHAGGGTLGVVPDDVFDAPSTRTASELLGTWGKDFPLLVIAEVEQENVVKSFRNLPGVFVVTSAETEVAELVWARLCSRPRPRCSSSREGPSNGLVGHPPGPARSGRLGEELQPDRREPVHVQGPQRRAPAPGPPGRRGAVRRPRPAREHGQGPVQAQAARMQKGRKPGWKKAVVQIRPGETIEIFGGAQV